MWDCGSVRLDSLHWIPGTGRCAGSQSGGSMIIRYDDEFEESSSAGGRSSAHIVSSSPWRV